MGRFLIKIAGYISSLPSSQFPVHYYYPIVLLVLLLYLDVYLMNVLCQERESACLDLLTSKEWEEKERKKCLSLRYGFVE